VSSEPRAVPVAMQSMIDWMHWIFTVALQEADVRQLQRACAGRQRQGRSGADAGASRALTQPAVAAGTLVIGNARIPGS